MVQNVTHASQCSQPCFCHFPSLPSKELNFPCLFFVLISPSLCSRLNEDNFDEEFAAQKWLCTIVFNGFYNSSHLLFVPPPFLLCKTFLKYREGEKCSPGCCPVLCCALISKLICSVAFIFPVKWQSVDAPRGLTLLFFLIISN